jgi:type IV pilus assembly protein PilX
MIVVVNMVMTMTRRSGSQVGAALIVSLLFLLIMTVVGITAVQVSSLEEKMSGNMRVRGLVFQAAESALRAAELSVGNDLDNNNLIGRFNSCSNGYYNLKCSGSNAIWTVVDWTKAIPGPALPNSSVVSAYIVEYLYDDGLAPKQSGGGIICASSCICYYRITAHAANAKGSAISTVQSVYTHRAMLIDPNGDVNSARTCE